jgi:hypothetical protein
MQTCLNYFEKVYILLLLLIIQTNASANLLPEGQLQIH